VRVAIVHDWLNQVGGAEAVLLALKELYPEAPVFTSMYWREKMPESFRSWDIRCSFMDGLPWVKQHHQPFLPLYPLAFESLDLSDYDLVISNKSGFCHGVLTSPETLHICYCLTPTRYVWDFRSYMNREGVSRWGRAALAPLLNYLRLWDRQAADRVDHFVSISETVRRRVEKYYRRESVVIYPPVGVERLATSADHDDYFLIVSRLIPYKRIDVAVQAFNELGLPLMVVGDGRDRERLQAMARRNVTFLGRLPQEDVWLRLSRCRAFVFPGLEDFGIAPVEAIAAGRPVIAFAGGGALDTVREGVSGTFFAPQTPEALAQAVRRFDDRLYGDPQRIAAEAQRFSDARFKERFRAFVEEKWTQHCERNTKIEVTHGIA
jgi:glycosyltransferase involved in cell wall biosynthesis